MLQRANVSILKDLEDSIKEIDKEFLQLRDDLLKLPEPRSMNSSKQSKGPNGYHFDEQQKRHRRPFESRKDEGNRGTQGGAQVASHGFRQREPP